MKIKQAQKIINNHKDVIEYFFPNYTIGGSYSRNEQNVNDIDIVCSDSVNHKEIIKTFGNKIRFLKHPHFIRYRFTLNNLKFEIYCVPEKYIPSSIFLIRGPNERCNKIWKEAINKGYYMTHYGLLPITQEIEFKERDQACYYSDNKIIFKTEQEYNNFIFNK